MRNFTIYLTVLACLLLTRIFAQETFESRAKNIASKIETITKEEKKALKEEVEAINVQLQNNGITKEEAEAKKQLLAETRAKSIEFRVAQAQSELVDLVQQKVDGKIKDADTTRRYSFSFTSRKKYKTYKDTIQGEKRTTSQFVFAAGLNNLVTNEAVAHSDFRYWGSHFYELGLTYNSRILKNNNLLHAKYGLSVMYNNLRPTDNRSFTENGNQTQLETSVIHLKDSRFRNVYLVAPIHLEFDFSGKETKNGKTSFKTHSSFRLGFGGYAGINVKSKQILDYESNGNDVKERTRGNFNVNEFIYGLSTYVGYKETSLYLKYDLNPLFKDNAIKQNNISLGVRFDLN